MGSESLVPPPGLVTRLGELFPGSRVEACQPLSERAGLGATEKSAGYGLPLQVRLRLSDGSPLQVVLRTASSNAFGHDRPSDRAQALLLDADLFDTIPLHVRVLDVGTVTPSGRLSPVVPGEFYLVTTFAEGTPYAADLRRVALEKVSGPRDIDRAVLLAHYLADLHRPEKNPEVAYVRAARDLVGHGEGIFGIIDGYPSGTPGAEPARLERMERLAARWRWKLKERTYRLSRIHGDFHPFNVIFSGERTFTLLDASRGCRGDPADDLTALAINYLFFALDAPGSWDEGFAPLWHAFWRGYQHARRDPELLSVAPPFFAWRALVVANPVFYPNFSAAARDRLLAFAEQALQHGVLDLDLKGLALT